MDKDWKPTNQDKLEKQIKPEKQEKPLRPEHHLEPMKINPRVWYIAGGVVLAIIILFAFIVPAFKGYSVYQALKASGVPDSYITDMKSLQNARTTLEDQLNQSEADVANKLQEISTCQQTISSCSSNLTALSNQISNLQTDVKNKQLAMDALDQDIAVRDAAIADAARRICCMKKVDDPTVNSYSLVDNKISCASNATTAISC